jgi:hypothetical protein
MPAKKNVPEELVPSSQKLNPVSDLIEVVKDIVQKQVHPDHNGEWLKETTQKLDEIQKSL